MSSGLLLTRLTHLSSACDFPARRVREIRAHGCKGLTLETTLWEPELQAGASFLSLLVQGEGEGLLPFMEQVPCSF